MEELLVFKSKNGNEKAFEALFRIWNPKVFGFAYQFTHDKEAAREITQETWLGVIKNFKKLKQESLFPIWIYRITQKKAADWMRQKYKHKHEEEEKLEVQQTTIIPAETVESHENILTHIRSEIAKMSANDRVILTLFYLENYDMEEISVILEIPKGTVKSRLHFAREKLKEVIKTNKKYQDEILR